MCVLCCLPYCLLCLDKVADACGSISLTKQQAEVRMMGCGSVTKPSPVTEVSENSSTDQNAQVEQQLLTPGASLLSNSITKQPAEIGMMGTVATASPVRSVSE
jgi:hypothetical protein